MTTPKEDMVEISQEEYSKLQKLQARTATSTKYNERRRKAQAILQKRHQPEFEAIMTDLDAGKTIEGVKMGTGS